MSDDGKYSDLDIILPFVSGNIIDDIARKMISEEKNVRDGWGQVPHDVIKTSGFSDS